MANKTPIFILTSFASIALSSCALKDADSSVVSSDQIESSSIAVASSSIDPDLIDYGNPSPTDDEYIAYAESNASWPEEEKEIRIAPYKATEDEQYAPVYTLQQDYDTGEYIKTIDKWISRDKNCFTYEEVAEYYAAFRDFPPNYSVASYPAEGDRAMRRVSQYDTSSYHSDSYVTSLGALRDSPATYYELDIDLTGGYNAGRGSYKRGAGRVVIVEGGLSEEGYGEEPTIYFTLNHYSDFVEYYNYSGGFSPIFQGLESGSGTVSGVPRISPETLDI